MDPADCHIAARLEAAAAEIAERKLPGAADCDLVARAIQTFLDNPSRARATMLRHEAIRARNRVLVELAEQHCADLRGVKPKADRIAAWARTYEGTAWSRDKHATVCPDRLRGRPKGLIWRALKSHPDFPRDRQLREILARAML